MNNYLQCPGSSISVVHSQIKEMIVKEGKPTVQGEEAFITALISIKDILIRTAFRNHKH